MDSSGTVLAENKEFIIHHHRRCHHHHPYHHRLHHHHHLYHYNHHHHRHRRHHHHYFYHYQHHHCRRRRLYRCSPRYRCRRHRHHHHATSSSSSNIISQSTQLLCIMMFVIALFSGWLSYSNILIDYCFFFLILYQTLSLTKLQSRLQNVVTTTLPNQESTGIAFGKLRQFAEAWRKEKPINNMRDNFNSILKSQRRHATVYFNDFVHKERAEVDPSFIVVHEKPITVLLIVHKKGYTGISTFTTHSAWNKGFQI